MTIGEAQMISDDQFRELLTKLDQISSDLTEREKAFVIQTFKEGVAAGEDEDVQGYVQLVEEAAGGMRDPAEPLSAEEARHLRQKLAAIGEQLTAQERVLVQRAFARGIQAQTDVQGYTWNVVGTASGSVSGAVSSPYDPYSTYVLGPSYDPDLSQFENSFPPASGPPPPY